jgi:hypothetical protein
MLKSLYGTSSNLLMVPAGAAAAGLHPTLHSIFSPCALGYGVVRDRHVAARRMQIRSDGE